MSNTYKIAVLAGDGIGPEVMAVGLDVLNATAKRFGFKIEAEGIRRGRRRHRRFSTTPCPTPRSKVASAAQAIFFGSIGGPKWEEFAAEPAAKERACASPLEETFRPLPRQPCVLRNVIPATAPRLADQERVDSRRLRRPRRARADRRPLLRPAQAHPHLRARRTGHRHDGL